MDQELTGAAECCGQSQCLSLNLVIAGIKLVIHPTRLNGLALVLLLKTSHESSGQACTLALITVGKSEDLVQWENAIPQQHRTKTFRIGSCSGDP